MGSCCSIDGKVAPAPVALAVADLAFEAVCLAFDSAPFGGPALATIMRTLYTKAQNVKIVTNNCQALMELVKWCGEGLTRKLGDSSCAQRMNDMQGILTDAQRLIEQWQVAGNISRFLNGSDVDRQFAGIAQRLRDLLSVFGAFYQNPPLAGAAEDFTDFSEHKQALQNLYALYQLRYTSSKKGSTAEAMLETHLLGLTRLVASLDGQVEFVVGKVVAGFPAETYGTDFRAMFDDLKARCNGSVDWSSIKVANFRQAVKYALTPMRQVDGSLRFPDLPPVQ